MSKYTPGPWFAGWGGGITGPNAAAMIEWTGKFPVHHVVEKDGYRFRYPICALPFADADHEANARLIAAAPDLLEILQKWTHDGCLQTFEDRERFRTEARAAIAKATQS